MLYIAVRIDQQTFRTVSIDMKTLIHIVMVVLLGTTLSAQQDRTITINSGGVERRFNVHFPTESPAAGLPLVLAYHGRGDSPLGMLWLSNLDELADRNSFVVAYPEARMIGDDVQWNNFVDAVPGHAGLAEPGAVSDVDFTRDIIDYMAANHAIDAKRVFATGFSSGGMMCYALAMLLSDRIAAIAPVAGNLWADTNFIPQLLASGSVRPMPVMHVHGTADIDVPYPDPDNKPEPYQEWPLSIVAAASGATTYSEVIPVAPGVDRLLFCTSPVHVSLIRILGMGHDWGTDAYATSSEIVKFFGLEAGVSSVERPAAAPKGIIAPSLANQSLRVDLVENGTVQIFSIHGSILYSAEHAAGSTKVPCGDLSAGMYLVRVLSSDARSVVAQGAVIVR